MFMAKEYNKKKMYKETYNAVICKNVIRIVLKETIYNNVCI